MTISSKMLFRLPVLLLLAAWLQTSVSQGKVVTGIVTDTRRVPVVGARICQVNTTNCTAADVNGIFHLLLEPTGEMSLNVTCMGFNPAEKVIDDTTSFPVTIIITPMYIPDEIFTNDFPANEATDVISRSSLGMDVLFSDFSEFRTLLGSFNTDAMDYFAVTGPEIGASFPRFYTGFGVGMGYSYKNNHDTVAIDLNNTQYKLTFGYDIISSHRIRMTPQVSLRWLKYRLRNYSADKKVPLEEYLRDREIDLRFNQTIATAGLNVEYLMYSGNKDRSDYWSLGIFGGYAVKLNRKPWIRSDGNRITTSDAIRLQPFTAGICLSYYTKSK
ncbi:hypothetical protein EG830_09300 [bacterium]|nr:hypothetical protein [bacterium]